MESSGELRKGLEAINAIVRRDLNYDSVAGKQIISALLKEAGVPFAKGLFYQVLQGVANEARRRSLLVNPNVNESYSTAVGNTARMCPSETGWEQTKGILSRHVAEAEGWTAERIVERLLVHLPTLA